MSCNFLILFKRRIFLEDASRHHNRRSARRDHLGNTQTSSPKRTHREGAGLQAMERTDRIGHQAEETDGG